MSAWIENRNGSLYIEDCRASDLAQHYKTPVYILSENCIRQKCQMVREQFTQKYERTHAAYASKALLTRSIAKIMNQEGLYLDVVSGGELYTALQADFPSEKIIFHGNNKSLEELEYAIHHQVGRIIVDNMYELIALNTLCTAMNRKTHVLFRVTPGVKSDTHHYITTGHSDSKFGFSLDDTSLKEAIQTVTDQPLIEFLGFHFHVGSQIFDVSSHVEALEIVLNELTLHQIAVQELNIGGGFAAKYIETDKPKDIAHFVDPIMALIERFSDAHGIERPTVFIEPGRFLVAEAGVTLYTVGAIKSRLSGKIFVSVDGGMTDNLRPALYQAQYEAKLVEKLNEPNIQTVTLCGKCCESGDILIESLPLPVVREDDIIAVFTTGAYHYSMASHYNKHPNPPVVLVNHGDSHIIIRRESYEDLLRLDEIPAHLK